MFQDNDGVWIQHQHLHLLPSLLRGDRKKHNSCWSNLSSDGILANDTVIINTVAIDLVCRISNLLWFYPVKWDTGCPHAKLNKLICQTSCALKMSCCGSSSIVHALQLLNQIPFSFVLHKLAQSKQRSPSLVAFCIHKGPEPWFLIWTADHATVVMTAVAVFKVDITYVLIKETKTKIIGM